MQVLMTIVAYSWFMGLTQALKMTVGFRRGKSSVQRATQPSTEMLRGRQRSINANAAMLSASKNASIKESYVRSKGSLVVQSL
jgi:hypothetical protein